VSDRTIEAPPIAEPAAVPPVDVHRRGLAPSLAREHPAVLTVAALLALSTVLVLWAGTRPGFDPYGWLVWGRQTLHWNLDTNGAPSWKPLPYLFTVPFGLAGHYALWLWTITAVAVSLSGVIFAGRIAYRLTGSSPESRYAAIGAAVFAGLALLQIRDYSHFILSSQSDTVIVSLCLGAIDCHLSGRPRLAFALGLLAALGRPEVWPFLGLYSLWAWWKLPSMRLLIFGGLLLIPLFWFGIPALTAKSPFVANNLAFNSPRELHGNKVTGVIDRFLDLHELPLQIAALLSIAVALLRRDRVLLVIAAAALGWVLVEIAFALHGFPAVPRYLFEPTGVMAVLAGVLVGRLLAGPPRWVHLPRWSGVLVAAALVAVLLPAARARVNAERTDLRHEHARAAQITALHTAIARAGGIHQVFACGQPVTVIEFESILAWEARVNVGITYLAESSIRARDPLVYFVPGANGWKLTPINTVPAMKARCHRLSAVTASF
jgi:hypothetical protein